MTESSEPEADDPEPDVPEPDVSPPEEPLPPELEVEPEPLPDPEVPLTFVESVRALTSSEPRPPLVPERSSEPPEPLLPEPLWESSEPDRLLSSRPPDCRLSPEPLRSDDPSWPEPEWREPESSEPLPLPEPRPECSAGCPPFSATRMSWPGPDLAVRAVPVVRATLSRAVLWLWLTGSGASTTPTTREPATSAVAPALATPAAPSPPTISAIRRPSLGGIEAAARATSGGGISTEAAWRSVTRARSGAGARRRRSRPARPQSPRSCGPRALA